MEICYKFGKAKSYPRNFWDATVQNGCGYLGHGTLDLAVSKKWVDGINWFFACCYRFGKAKSNFNNFWLGGVRNGCGHLSHWTLKLAVSQEYIDELSWFFTFWQWCNNFWSYH